MNNNPIISSVSHPTGVAHRTYAADHNSEAIQWVPKGTSLVLDIGCGAGSNAAYLARQGISVDGVTLSTEEARSARQWCRNVSVHNVESGLPPLMEGPYDVVLCSHVLEHICFPQQLLRDIGARLKPGGLLIVAVPNLLYFKNRVNLLRGRFEYQEGGLMDDTHFRWYTLSTMTRLLHEHGFHAEHAYGSGNAPLGPLRKFLPRLCEQADRAACRAMPGLFGWQLIVIASIR